MQGVPQSVGNRCHDGQSSGHRWSRNQKRAKKNCSRQESIRTIELIDVVGNRRTLRRRGRLNNINHWFVLAALERRSLQYCNGSVRTAVTGANAMDEMGTVELGRDMRDEEEWRRRMREKWQKNRNVLEDILKIHGVAPGLKVEGITWLLYKNANGIQFK